MRCTQHVVSEVELVVAERGDVEARRVERRDHLLALEHARGDRGGQKVAREDEERRAAFRGDALLQRGDAREAAEAVHRRQRIDVVQLEEGERRPRSRRRLVVIVVSILSEQYVRPASVADGT